MYLNSIMWRSFSDRNNLQMLSVNDLYILPEGSKETTFQYDSKLPNLPLPTLKHTLDRYLDSVKPFLSDEEYVTTENIVKDFECGIGKKLHEELAKKAASERNWLEKWWEDYAYLSNREPLLPNCNMTGPSPTSDLGWTFGPGKQILFASRYCYHMVSVWTLIRQQRLRPLKIYSSSAGKTKYYNMNQYRRLFNTCQIPDKFVDKLQCSFKTESEGDCPSHVIVLFNGHIYRMETFHPNGGQLTVAEWEKMLTLIVQDGIEERGDSIACLTADKRTRWAENRQYLIDLDPNNGKYLNEIETSMFVLCLDSETPRELSLVGHYSLAGDLTCRWADAALNIVFFHNGTSAGLSNHCAYDGTVSVTTMHFLHLALAENKDDWKNSISVRPGLVRPSKLNFTLDSNAKQRIDEVMEFQNISKYQFIMYRDTFHGFGKDLIQMYKLHPDAFVQMALQLAYYKLHDRPAPCYETASTRNFYNGRTETLRSCTQEAVDWCEAMLDNMSNSEERIRLLKVALEKHVKLMKEAQQNAGCDRHLFGLQIIAYENGIALPELYKDPSYTKSGGGGNFILSTSQVGYTQLGGGVMPMCIEGYGCFYNICSNMIQVTVSVNTKSYDTSVIRFFRSFSEALQDMASLLKQLKIESKL